DQQSILPYFRTATFEFDHKNYFVAIGWQHKLEIEQEIIEEIELNGGMLTALLLPVVMLIIPLITQLQKPHPITTLTPFLKKNQKSLLFPELSHFPPIPTVKLSPGKLPTLPYT
ncbi:MAG: hypothetical protein ACLBM4_19765, partial [Dolichospermum sp.]